MTRFFPWKKLGSITFFSLTSITYLVHEAVVFGATIGAAIMVGVLGLPPTVITWCGPGEPITYRKKKSTLLVFLCNCRKKFIQWTVTSCKPIGKSLYNQSLSLILRHLFPRKKVTRQKKVSFRGYCFNKTKFS